LKQNNQEQSLRTTSKTLHVGRHSWFALNETLNVTQHAKFWMVIILPLVLSVPVFYLNFAEQYIKLTPRGVEHFWSLAKIPFGIASFSLVFGVMFFRLHASKQRTLNLNRKQKLDQEMVFLEIIEKSYVQVGELINNENNSTIIWVRAARILLEAEALRAKIRTSAIAHAATLSAMQLRNKLYDQLAFDKIDVDTRHPLPAQYFYGIEDWASEKSIDEAAKHSSTRIKAHKLALDSVSPSIAHTAINPKAVIAIYDFMNYPDNYVDLLEQVQTWEGDGFDGLPHAQGARRYIAHQQQFRAFNGKLIPNTQGRHND